MRTASLAIALLLLGTATLAIGTLLTFVTTLSTDLAAVGTLVVLVLAVLAASALGTWADKDPSTPYWQKSLLGPEKRMSGWRNL
jgi:hypothetical protein